MSKLKLKSLIFNHKYGLKKSSRTFKKKIPMVFKKDPYGF